MHLRNYPRYFIKDGERRPAYFTVEQTELIAQGWVPEESGLPSTTEPGSGLDPIAEPAPEPTVEQVAAQEKVIEPVEVVVEDDPILPVAPEAPLPDFEFMTKQELIDYASERGVELKPALHKSDLVEECRKL